MLSNFSSQVICSGEATPVEMLAEFVKGLDELVWDSTVLVYVDDVARGDACGCSSVFLSDVSWIPDNWVGALDDWVGALGPIGG